MPRTSGRRPLPELHTDPDITVTSAVAPVAGAPARIELRHTAVDGAVFTLEIAVDGRLRSFRVDDVTDDRQVITARAIRTVITPLETFARRYFASLSAVLRAGWSAESERYLESTEEGVAASKRAAAKLRERGEHELAELVLAQGETELRMALGGTHYLGRVVESGRTSARRGPKPLDDRLYAETAAAYVDAGHSVPGAAKALRVKSVTTVRNRVHEARRRGLLTPTERGRAGGELTDKAREILAAKEASTHGQR